MLVVSAHAVVDDGVVVVGDLGVVEPLDVIEEGEELSVGDRIEREQTFLSVYFLSSVHLHGSAATATDKAGNSALQSRRCFLSSLDPILLFASGWITLCLSAWILLVRISIRCPTMDSELGFFRGSVGTVQCGI